MKRIFPLILLLAFLTAISFVAYAEENAEQTVEEKIDSLMSAYDEAPSDSAKLAICVDVLEKYPESDYTVALLGVSKYHMDNLNRTDEFIPFAEKISSRITDPNYQVQVGRFMAGVYGEMKELDKLNSVAEKLSAAREKTFNLYFDLIQAYTDVEKWQRILDYAGDAERFASAKAYKEEFPKSDLSDEKLEERGKNRQGLLLTFSGWAKANLGKLGEAMEDYKAADKLMKRMYMGQSESELDYFWGETLAKSGRLEQALERLARKALFGEDQDAQEAMRGAYVSLKGSDSGYEEYLKGKRTELAKPVDDFSLAGYDGEKLTLSSLKGKVVLLSFWFPT